MERYVQRNLIKSCPKAKQGIKVQKSGLDLFFLFSVRVKVSLFISPYQCVTFIIAAAALAAGTGNIPSIPTRTGAATAPIFGAGHFLNSSIVSDRNTVSHCKKIK